MGFFSNNIGGRSTFHGYSGGVRGGGTTIEIHGLDEIRRSLQQLQKRTVRKVLGKAVRAAAKPTAKQARSNAPVESGSLRRSVVVRVKRYKNGNIVAAIGPRYGKRDYKATKRKAARTEDAYYGWMVEFNTRAHFIHAVDADALMIPGYGFFGSAMPTGTRGSHFMRRAFKQTVTQSKNAFNDKAWAEIQSEVRKARR